MRYKVRNDFFKNRCADIAQLLIERENNCEGHWWDLHIEEFILLVPWAQQFTSFNKKQIGIFSGSYVFRNGKKYQKEYMNDFKIYIHESQIDYGNWQPQRRRIQEAIERNRNEGNIAAVTRLRQRLRSLGILLMRRYGCRWMPHVM